MRADQLKIARAVALVFAAIGLAIGLWSIHVPALNGTEDCGSPFQASSYQSDGTGSLIVGECDSERQSRMLWALVLLGAGLVGAAAAQHAIDPWRRFVGAPDPQSSAGAEPPS